MTGGEVLIAVLTVICAGGASFVGAWVANRSTKAQDKREREAAEWARITSWVTMACSQNPTEAYVGLYHLQQAKGDWNDNQEQREFIKRTLLALSAAPAQAYHGGATTVVSPPPPSPPSLPGGAP